MTTTVLSPPAPPANAPPTARGRPSGRRATSLFSAGEPQVWLTGGALVLCLIMIVGLLVLVISRGIGTFWPAALVQVQTAGGKAYLGEVTVEETYQPEDHAFDVLPEPVREYLRAPVNERDLGKVPEALRAAASNALAVKERGTSTRRMIRTGNFELAGTHYTWVSDFEVARETNPEWALTVERMGNGRFYGTPKAFLLGEAVKYEARPDGSRHALLPSPESMAKVAEGPEAAWAKFEEFHDDVRERWERRVDIEKDENGEVNARIEEARFAVKKKDLDLADDSLRELAVKVVDGRLERELWEARRRAAEETAAKERAAGREPAPFTDPEPSGPRLLAEDGVRLERWRAEMDAMLVARREEHAVQQQAERDYLAIRDRIDELNAENARYVLLLETADGQEKRLTLDEIVRAYPANRLGTGGRLGVYASRWGEFLGDEPRESNMEGGVLPAIFGTVVMTLIMSLLVVPFGVMAALYLREYAKPGPLVSIVRIAINNLAGVPSIVFGVFGLGFFCYTIGAGIDELLFAERLPSPTYGTGGLLWASLTLALLTLPVVIVATEEALSAVPRSMREGSYACGASKWQTIRRIVLPRAMPGIMTGMILAIARGAGEVAPLMLVGAVKLAPQMPVDGEFPFLHAERSFMHLGFHIYDLGFQSSNSEAAKPMVFTTTLLLIGIVVLLNVVAIWVRSRLRRKFSAGQA